MEKRSFAWLQIISSRFASDIDSEVGDSDDFGVEISDEAFPDQCNVDFVDETVTSQRCCWKQTMLL